eukprot:CAMPEP_0116040466 /NCGR_PEP_ID=MMETSP0321-20121206/24381_1 /TAXON_ID=163516 /ORGANISM="Leptocylindrus danicus var. danicus, Strain B650" /LENGTH=432 /DNA_ID=CAMNT_0003520297 /DNA_START=114 /DNA_END=1409 /DNA_ORIENTATION=+
MAESTALQADTAATLQQQNDASNTSKNEQPVSSLSTILESLKAQLEYYFSAQNLAKDMFLQSILLQNQGYCNLETLAVRICEGADDVPKLLTDAAATSDVLIVKRTEDDDDVPLGIGPKIIQNQKSARRNTIILREVPPEVTEEDIRSVFSWDGCPVVESVRLDVGNYWFVSLDATDDETVSTLLNLRNMKLNDEPIKARLKTESAAKSFYASIPEMKSIPSRSTSGDGRFGAPKNGEHGYHYDNSHRYGHKSGYHRNKGKLGLSKEKRMGPKKVERERVSPPPMVESHFPALGGKGIIKSSSKDDVTENTATTTSTENGASPSSEERANAVLTETAKTVGGYAAALLKAAPPVPKTPSPSASGRSSPAAQKNKNTSSSKATNASKKEKENKVEKATSNVKSNVKDDSTSLTSVVSSEQSVSPGPAPPTAAW